MTIAEEFGKLGTSIINLVKTRASVNMDNLTETGLANITLAASGIPKTAVSNVVLSATGTSYTDSKVSGTFRGMVPNGRYSDGSLKSTESVVELSAVTPTVYVKSSTNKGGTAETSKGTLYLFTNTSKAVVAAPYTVSYVAPTGATSGDMWYDLSTNLLKSYGTSWATYPGFKIGKMEIAANGTKSVYFDGALQLLDAGTIVDKIQDCSAPVGTVIAYMGTDIPEGYLLMDGRTLSRNTYRALFDVIGTTQGAGDGSTTFGIADMTDGRYLMGSTVAGGSVSESVPNITGEFQIGNDNPIISTNCSGAFCEINNGHTDRFGYHDVIGSRATAFDASRVSDIYKDGAHVNPMSLECTFLIRY